MSRKWPDKRPKGMPRLAWKKLRTCTRKNYYRRKGEAKRVGHPAGLFVYACPYCSGYHLSSKRARQAKPQKPTQPAQETKPQ